MSRAARTLPAFLATVVVAATVVAGVAATERVAFAQQVFSGDPVDPLTSLPYPIMPGLGLLFSGDDLEFGNGDDVINNSVIGDVDLVVRSGSVGVGAIPPPSLAIGGAPIATVVAGGGSSGQGGEATFTVMVSDGSGAAPSAGNVLTSSDMDLRPVTVYAFADLDGDGLIGPSNFDSTSDNSLELQEATTYVGRQMGGLFGGLFQDSVGLEMGAPASIGGLTIALTAGAWTGTNANKNFTDGPLILTRWPLFPPLDPKDLLGGGDAPDPDPTKPNQLEWAIDKNYLPSPSSFGNRFALPADGTSPSNDQLHVVSASAVSARVFAEPLASKFVARSRPRLRVAAAVGASGRALVLPVDRVVLAADGATSQLTLRVLPTDLFANDADPSSPIAVTLTVSGPASIVSPDTDSNPKTEPLSLTDAEGSVIVLDDSGTGSAKLRLSVAGNPTQTVDLAIGAAADSDGDGVPDDGNASGLSGDKACIAGATSCDDNCPRVINPSQVDSDDDGIGDCCDGTCILFPLDPFCDECALPVDPTPTSLPFTSVKLGMKLGGGTSDDKVTIKLAFTLAPGANIVPDAESVMLATTQVGHGGWTATLASLFTDLMKPTPSFRYTDSGGAVDGVVKSSIKCKSDGTCKMMLRADGLSIADLASGSAELSLALGDDLFDGTLACTGVAPKIKCSLAP